MYVIILKRLGPSTIDKATEYLGDGDVTRMTEKTILALRKHLIEDDGESNAAILTRTWNPLIKRVERSRHSELGQTASALAVESGADIERAYYFKINRRLVCVKSPACSR